MKLVIGDLTIRRLKKDLRFTVIRKTQGYDYRVSILGSSSISLMIYYDLLVSSSKSKKVRETFENFSKGFGFDFTFKVPIGYVNREHYDGLIRVMLNHCFGEDVH